MGFVVGHEGPVEWREPAEQWLRPSLDGVRFPAPRWLVLVYADYNGVGYPLRSALLRLPERLYRDLGDAREMSLTPRDGQIS